MALNCGGRPPDEHNRATAPGLLLIKKGSDINMPMQTMAASNPMASTIIFGAHESVTPTGHHMKFAGGSRSSSYVRSGTSAHGDYIGTMSSCGNYASGGQTAESFYSEIYEPGSGPAQLQLGRSDQHCRKEATHFQQYQQGDAPANYQPVAVQGEKKSSSPVFNMQMVHVASQGNLHEHPRSYYKVSDHDISSGRSTRKVPPGKKVVETRGRQQEDEDEDEEVERAEVRSRNEEQSMQYELHAPALLIGVSSHGELAGMSTSSGGGDTMSMMMMKKRRLTNEQVRSLEVSFERESKLEPERKNELAMELGLQPRQVAVWFQNRRARFKTKQLERDFDLLKLQYDAVRCEKDKLQAQVARLKDLLDAQMASSSKGNTPTTSSEKQGMDDGMSTLHSSPQKQLDATVQSYMDGGVDILKAAVAGVGDRAKHAEVFSTHDSDPTLVRACAQLEVAQSSNKAPIALEVKPSLQVPHINHHRQTVYKEQQQQQDFSNTFSPPTKLSLCSSQQLFLHQMVSMRMEGESFCNPPYHDQPPHNLYNQEPYNLPRLNENEEEEYRTDSMICFDSAWHHDP